MGRSRPVRSLLIHGETLTLDAFDLEVFDRLVIELKLPLERAIGHPPPLAQERDHLLHPCNKVHPLSSLVRSFRVHAHLHHSIGDRPRAEGSAEVESRE
jgi:hypothetical protein